MRTSIIFGITLLALATVTTCASHGRTEIPSRDGFQIIPRPMHLVLHEGRFTITKKTAMEIEGDYHSIMPTAGFLTETIQKTTGIALTFSNGQEEKTKSIINLTLDDTLSDLGIEGYRLSVQPDRIDLKAYKPAGLFYAVQTLLQLMPPAVYQTSSPSKKIKIRIPCVEIKDRPRFGWRGLMLDVSRHFFPTEFIYRFIDFLAMHKLNT
ncbi:MAG: beta-N-acetylhexosaminidase, partial [Candidatus Aminicenantes bacterium]|nr:beta-N-acetylhexosaminidase [Candidatus Aminicenantes bacterium]